MASMRSLLAISLQLLLPYRRISTNLCSGDTFTSVFRVLDTCSSRVEQNDGNVRGNAQSFHHRHHICIWSYLKNYDEIGVPEDD